MQRRYFEGWSEGKFSVGDAKTAGLWGKNVHATYPKDMLLWKARKRAYDSGFPDVLGGATFAEDLQGLERTALEVEATEVSSKPLAIGAEGGRVAFGTRRLPVVDVPAAAPETKAEEGGNGETAEEEAAEGAEAK